MLFDAAKNYAQAQPLAAPIRHRAARAAERGGAGGSGNELPRPVRAPDSGLPCAGRSAFRATACASIPAKARIRGCGGGGVDPGRKNWSTSMPVMSRNATSGPCSIAPVAARPVRTSPAGAAGAALRVDRAAGDAWRAVPHHRLGIVDEKAGSIIRATVIQDQAGEVVAIARALWIEVIRSLAPERRRRFHDAREVNPGLAAGAKLGIEPVGLSLSAGQASILAATGGPRRPAGR